jgi:hypothetical protein
VGRSRREQPTLIYISGRKRATVDGIRRAHQAGRLHPPESSDARDRRLCLPWNQVVTSAQPRHRAASTRRCIELQLDAVARLVLGPQPPRQVTSTWWPLGHHRRHRRKVDPPPGARSHRTVPQTCAKKQSFIREHAPAELPGATSASTFAEPPDLSPRQRKSAVLPHIHEAGPTGESGSE